MQNFIIGLLSSIIIIVIIIAIILWMTGPTKPVIKDDNSKQKEESSNNKKGSTLSYFFRQVLRFLFFVCFIFVCFVVASLIFRITDADKIEQSSPLYHYRTIEFSGEYGETIYLPSGSKFAFIDATEPYCCRNASGLSVCGQKYEDISTLMGDDHSNMKLVFMSTNKKNGSLKIRIRDK